ncbi:cytochrome C oxidase subunit II [Paenibacillus sp. 7124]|uniref:Cytochrome C oxidase subunit II n=1 Tax=Paenibacillus apii TaxID=1850370 RepID=A0A6M1PK67_9BACL|nr:cytochrome C oxidase subunit II [Paenibacillus apii]NGM82964.1 cytochrome C oxidase subunit II [Paenibacillus apii]NJJ40103.1 cytochrome C oxidase subunit II [Paenibacillus apii]
MKKTALYLTSITLLLTLVSGCGKPSNGGNTADSGTGSTAVTASAQEEIVIKATNFRFDQKEYHLKKGIPVKITLENASGNHGILVPELELQLSGKHLSQVIVPEQAGTFKMTCSVFCGSGHSQMNADLIVE